MVKCSEFDNFIETSDENKVSKEWNVVFHRMCYSRLCVKPHKLGVKYKIVQEWTICFERPEDYVFGGRSDLLLNGIWEN